MVLSNRKRKLLAVLLTAGLMCSLPGMSALAGSTGVGAAKTAAEQGGQVVDVSGALPKSFVLTEEFGMDRVYLTQFNAAILEKRMEQKENTIHV